MIANNFIFAQQTQIGILGGVAKNHVKYTVPIPKSCLSIGTPATFQYGLFVQKAISKQWDARITFRKVFFKNTESSICARNGYSRGVSVISPLRIAFTPIWHIGKRDKPHLTLKMGLVYECAWRTSTQTSEGIYENGDDYHEIRTTNRHLNNHNLLITNGIGIEIPDKKQRIVTLELIYQHGFVQTYQYDYYLRFSKDFDDFLKSSKIWKGSNLLFNITIRRPWRIKPKKETRK